jgi:ubiquinone/menaquinone biosynthesis C-methylase UbiE
MNKSEKFWNKLSKNYDKRAKDKTFEQILHRSRKYLGPDDIILDFACATGLYSFEFANDVNKIQAFDTSSKMINIAKNKAGKSGNDTIIYSGESIIPEDLISKENIISALCLIDSSK